MWAVPTVVAALLISAVLLRGRPLLALTVTLGGAVALRAQQATTSGTTLLALQAVVACSTGLGICYLAVTRTRRISLAAGIAAVVVQVIAVLSAPVPALLSDGTGGQSVVAITVPLVTIIAWLIGNTIRQAHTQAELARSETAARTAMAERLRIARELHDLVAHSIGVIAIQAGAGRRVFDTRPDQARDALAAIEATSRETLSGLRRMVGGLRHTEPGSDPLPAPPDPAPGLAGLPQLAATTLAAGVRVDLDWRGSRKPLPADIDRSAFRIIQEAVTNVVRHAGTPRCHVLIDRQDEQLSIEITDQGHGHRTAGAGYGIIGMRERAILLGGDLFAGPCPGGGFRVVARLPVPGTAP